MDRIGVIGPDGLTALCDQVNELGAHYFNATHLRSFNKNRKTIKKWGKCVMLQLTYLGWLVGWFFSTVFGQVASTTVFTHTTNSFA